MAGEERCGMSIGSHAKQNEVEDREASRVLLGELLDELFLVRIRQLFKIVQESGVEGVYLFLRNWNLGEEDFRAGSVIGVRVVERDHTLINVEDMPGFCVIKTKNKNL